MPRRSTEIHRKKRTANGENTRKIYDRRNFALYLSPVCPGNLAFWHIGTYDKIIWKKSKLQYFNYSRFLSFSFHFVSFCVCFSFFSDTDAVGFPLLFRVIISRLFAIVHRVRIQLLLLLRRRERISYCLIGVCTVCSVHFSFAFVRRISSLQFAYTFFFWFWLCKLCKGFSVVPFVLAHSLAWSLFARGFEDLNSTTIKRKKNWLRTSRFIRFFILWDRESVRLTGRNHLYYDSLNLQIVAICHTLI